jgi:hypothetical protein
MTSDVDKGRPRGRAVFLSAAQSTEAKSVVTCEYGRPAFQQDEQAGGNGRAVGGSFLTCRQHLLRCAVGVDRRVMFERHN